MNGPSPWMLHIDHVASPMPPVEAIKYLQLHADQMGITLIGEVNSSKYMAMPEGKEPTKLPQ